MHLAAFVDDVAAAAQRLTVAAGDADPQQQRELATAVPAAPVTVDVDATPGPARLVRLADGDLGLELSAEESAFRVGPDLTLRGTASIDGDVSAPLGAVDETTFRLPAADPSTVAAGTSAIARLAHATDGGTFYAGVGPLARIGPDGEAREIVQAARAGDTAVNVYGASTGDWDAPGHVSVRAAAIGELERTRFAVYDGAGADRLQAAMLAVPTGEEGYRGFLTLRSPLVEDLTAYLERTYGRERCARETARGT